MEKILEKIRNLLNLSGNNPNEHEALAAALKAQELMAKYNVEMADLDGDRRWGGEITTIFCKNRPGGSKKWLYSLSKAVAANFRCMVFVLSGNGGGAAFYGREADAKAASEVYAYLRDAGEGLAQRERREAKLNRKPTRGVVPAYLAGFSRGVESALAAQGAALAVVTPPEVEAGFNNLMAAIGLEKRKVETRINNKQSYDHGYSDGRLAVQARAIAAG